MKTLSFRGKILVLGCGGVSRCTLPLLLKHLDMPRENITVMDMVDNRTLIGDVLAEGVQYCQMQLTRDRLRDQWAERTKA